MLVLTISTAKDETIDALPDTWDSTSEAAHHPEEAERFTELSTHLKSLKERKEEMRAKIERYKALKKQLEPLNEASRVVQENLCTKNSAVEEELTKMRMLIARVNGRLETLPPVVGNGGGDVMELDEEAKMAALFR